jgi:nitrous oxidase accessory protein NosD
VGSGIYLAQDASDVLIQDNIVETNSVYGIVATGAIDSLIVQGNHAIRNSVGTTHTYDGINIDGTSITKLIVSGNSALNVGGTEQRYGIVVSPAATSSVVSNNNASSNTAGCSLTDASIVYGNSGTGCTGREIVSSIASGSAVNVLNATAKDVTSVSLPAGEWLCYGNVNFYPAGGTTISSIGGWISSASAAVPTRPNNGSFAEITANLIAGGNQSLPVGNIWLSLGSTTTIYLEAYSTFAVSTMGAGGFIGCRRAL